jgi:predicted ABC-type ATPase
LRKKKPPSLLALLRKTVAEANKPVAFVLAGHNGSGKSTLWNERLSDALEIPLINADRLTASILPERNPTTLMVPDWAQRFRDYDERWQLLAQSSVRAIVALVMEQQLAFAMETVFSHWEKKQDGSFYSSKIHEIQNMQAAGYLVVLLFVGLASAELSALRVETRVQSGGHSVARKKLFERFPRTQAAIRVASKIANLTLMFDNSRGYSDAFSLVRAQARESILFDCRDPAFSVNSELKEIAESWLPKVAGTFGA